MTQDRSDLEAQFAQAQADLEALAKRPSAPDLQFLYAHHSQATLGDVPGKRPSAFHPVERVRYDAHRQLLGMSREDAMRAYIAKVEELTGR